MKARTFSPFLYYYELQSVDRKGSDYVGTLTRVSLIEPRSAVPETDLDLQTMADDVAKTVLQILDKSEQGVAINFTLVLAAESRVPALWLLGTQTLVFFRPDLPQHVKRRRTVAGGAHQDVGSCNQENFVLIPREMSAADFAPRRHLSEGRYCSAPRAQTAAGTQRGKTPSRNLNARDTEGRSTKGITISVRSKSQTGLILRQRSMGGEPRALEKHKRLLVLNRARVVMRGPLTSRKEQRLTMERAMEVFPVGRKLSRGHVRVRSQLEGGQKRCGGDFCKFACCDGRKTAANSGLFYPIDTLLIYVGRTKMFSPYTNSAITQPTSTFISTSNGATPTPAENDMIYPIEPDDSTYKTAGEQDRVQFVVRVKKTLADEQTDSLVAQIKEKVASEPAALNMAPESVIRLVKQYGRSKKTEVCARCKAIYKNILRCLAKLVLGVTETQ